MLAGTVLALAIVATYASSLRGEFLWDDDLHITANPTIIGPLGLKEIWTTARANYFPLVLTNFWLQHALWDLNPLGYRIVTLACHVLAALLLWRVLRQLMWAFRPRIAADHAGDAQATGSDAARAELAAWLGAALWALHPVQAESVAWICELKNTQSAVFFLLAIWFWLRWLEVGTALRAVRGRPQEASPPKAGSNAYALALACALLAILSKPSTVMLPIALALCTWWRLLAGGSTATSGRRQEALEGRTRPEVAFPLKRIFVALAPFAMLSAFAAGWTIWEQKFHSGASGAEWAQTWPERFAIAGRVVWFYLGKLAWPEPLMFIYPRWQISASNPLAYLPLLLAGGAVFGLWRMRNRNPVTRVALLTAAYFVALLFPVLGFFDVFFFRYSFVGDHFQYLASLGPLALLGAAIACLPSRWRKGASAGLVLGLALLTAKQTRIYHSNETLWRDAVAHNPTAPMPWLNLADTLARRGQHAEAIAAFTRATEIRPDDYHAWNDLGCELLIAGRPDEAIADLERALSLKPDFAETHNNLGNALRAVGRKAQAVAQYRRAIELKPDYVEARNNLGAELAEGGQIEEALGQFHAALKLDPKHVATHDNLGSALQRLGRFAEAIAEHREAVRLKPDFAEAHANLGRALVAAGRPRDAIAEFEQALRLKPDLPLARSSYAAALTALGRPDDALAQLKRAVKLAPKSAEAQQNLGSALAQLGALDEAREHFRAAVRLAPESVAARLNLGTALGAAGRWSDAAAEFAEAARLAPENADALTKLAIALVNAERVADAVAPFETALRLNPNSAELHDNFAQVLRALGRNREAFEHFERAADLRRKR